MVRQTVSTICRRVSRSARWLWCSGGCQTLSVPCKRQGSLGPLMQGCQHELPMARQALQAQQQSQPADMER